MKIDKNIPLQIEKNIPIPVKRNKYPLGEMEIGDSFLIPNASATKGMNTCFYKWPERKFVTKVYPEGRRVWRVA